MDLARAYYTGVMGLDLTEDTGDRAFFKCWDEEDHHSLRCATTPGSAWTATPSRSSTRTTSPSSSAASRRTASTSTGSRAARQSARVSRSGSRCRPARDGAGLGRREGRWPRRQAQPRAAAWTSPASPRPGWTTCSSTPRRWGRGEVLHGRARLPDDRAAARRRRPPDRGLDGALALPPRHRDRQRPQRRTAPLRVLARRLGPRPQLRRHPRLQRRPDRRQARPGTESPAATPSTSSTRWAPATRSSPAATAPTRTSRPSPGPRTTSARPSSTTRASSTSASSASTPRAHRPRETRSVGILRLSTWRCAVPTSSCPRPTTPRSSASSRPPRTDDAVFLKCWDEQQHHSVILRYAPTYGLDHIGFKVAEAADLDDYGRDRGLRNRHEALRGRGARTRLGRDDPLRRAERARHRARPRHGAGRQRAAVAQPAARAQGLSGMHPPRLDHVFLMCEDVDGTPRFYTRGARLPAHRADRRRRRPPARHLPRAHAHRARRRVHHRPERRVPPLRVLGRRLERPPPRRRHRGVPRRPHRRRAHAARRHPRLGPVLLRPGRQPQRGLHRRLLGRPRPRADHLDRGARWAGPIFYYEGVVNQHFLTVHS